MVGSCFIWIGFGFVLVGVRCFVFRVGRRGGDFFRGIGNSMETVRSVGVSICIEGF